MSDFAIGNKFFRTGHYDEAIAAYKRALAHGPHTQVVRDNLARAMEMLKKGVDANAAHSASAIAQAAESVRPQAKERDGQPPHFGQPALSIIVPVHNTEKYLERCIDSILAQTVHDFELLVVDDGSTDSSPRILQKLMLRDSRLRVITNRKASGSPGTPRNQALEIARGAYVGFVDSDDWIDSDYFERLLAKANECQSDIVFTGGFRNVKPDGVDIRRYPPLHHEPELRGYHQSFMIWDKIFRRDLLEKHCIRLAETPAAVDVPFILKAYYYLPKWDVCGDLHGYNYRRESDTSVTVGFRKKSNCLFEFDVYADVENWAAKKTSPEYQKIIGFRKLSSYVYTLGIIGENFAQGYYDHAREELSHLAMEDVASIALLLKKKSLEKSHADILRLGTYADYASLHVKKNAAGANKLNTASPQPQPHSKLLHETPVTGVPSGMVPQRIDETNQYLDIPGPRAGILFCQDWSKSNPYQKLLYGALAATYGTRIRGFQSTLLSRELLKEHAGAYRVLHLHWLHTMLDLSRDDGGDSLLDLLQYAKSLGYTIAYTAHNIISHDIAGDQRVRELRFRRAVMQHVDVILAHGQYAKDRLIHEIGASSEKIHVIEHGNYVGYYPNNVSRSVARKRLSINPSEFVILFFGNIRPYKGVENLLSAFREIRAQYKHVRLLIAGRILDQELGKALQADLASDNSQITLVTEFIPESDVQLYYNAADLAVLPYRHIVTSGAALLGLSFGTPIVAPATGTIPEYVQDGKQGFLFNSDAELKLKLIQAVERGQDNQANTPFDFSEAHHRLSWANLVKREPFASMFLRTTSNAPDNPHKPFRYALVRIIGNNIPGLHNPRQSIQNLRFTLENEPHFNDCKKLWVLNRITDRKTRDILIELLREHGADWREIAFDHDAYSQLPWNFEELPAPSFLHEKTYAKYDEDRKRDTQIVVLKHHSQYLINNNGARNFALDIGRDFAEWVMPWDGNCFMPKQAWDSLLDGIQQQAGTKYHIVAMERLTNNYTILDSTYEPCPTEEPQIVFHADAACRFDPELIYGFKPKVDLLKRLGVPGAWDKWGKMYPWTSYHTIFCRDSYNYAWSGWCARLSSGRSTEAQDAVQRKFSRSIGTLRMLKDTDIRTRFAGFDRANLAYFNAELLDLLAVHFKRRSQSPHVRPLLKKAQDYLDGPVYSVTSKSTLPPNGSIHDYWHPDPYAWPNPATPDGLPYVHRDGKRVPGTRMYEPESGKFDRTSLQRLFDETTILALAGAITGEERYLRRAHALIQAWFITPKTRMNPHLEFARVFTGRNGNKGTAAGLIETKDFYFFLDAVRIVRSSACWGQEDERQMDSWIEAFLDWLNTSNQGKAEVASRNNHGTAFDLQTYALAAYLGDTTQMYDILVRAIARLPDQIEADGTQPHEMCRTATAHYSTFNLQLWLNLNTLFRRTAGYDVLQYDYPYGKGQYSKPLSTALHWIFSRADQPWQFKQIGHFDKHRYEPLHFMSGTENDTLKSPQGELVESVVAAQPLLRSHDGIAPFWTFSLGIGQLDLSCDEQHTEAHSPRVSTTGAEGLRLGAGVDIDASVKLIYGPDMEIVIGNKTRMYRGGEVMGPATIGQRCFFNRDLYMRPHTTLADDVAVGPFCRFITDTHEIGSSNRRAGKKIYKPITVGRGTWLGAGVTVIGGVRIGAGCVIAAGAMVTTDIPDNTLAGGVPAKVLRTLDDAAIKSSGPPDAGSLEETGKIQANRQDIHSELAPDTQP